MRTTTDPRNSTREASKRDSSLTASAETNYRVDRYGRRYDSNGVIVGPWTPRAQRVTALLRSMR